MDGNENSTDHLDLFRRRQAVLRDRVRGVAGGHYTGFYLFGPPGTGKTHAVRTALSDVGARYAYHAGHLTPMGLFDLLAEHPDETLVLDDVGAILSDRVGLQLLLSALGNQPLGCGPRVVRYKRLGREEVVHFRGGIILISNLELHAAPLLQALRSRVHVLRYAPTDAELAAQVRHLCTNGWPASRPLLNPDECRRVAEFVVEESGRLGRRLDFRLVFDKAFPDYLQHRMGEAELHWRDLVLSALRESGGEPKYTLPGLDSRAERLRVERQVAERLRREHAGDVGEQLRHWREQTEKSDRAFWRRLKEIDGGDGGHPVQ